MLRASYVCFIVAMIMIVGIYFLPIPFSPLIGLVLLVVGTVLGFRIWRINKDTKSLVAFILNCAGLLIFIVPVLLISTFINY